MWIRLCLPAAYIDGIEVDATLEELRKVLVRAADECFGTWSHQKPRI